MCGLGESGNWFWVLRRLDYTEEQNPEHLVFLISSTATGGGPVPIPSSPTHPPTHKTTHTPTSRRRWRHWPSKPSAHLPPHLPPFGFLAACTAWAARPDDSARSDRARAAAVGRGNGAAQLRDAISCSTSRHSWVCMSWVIQGRESLIG